MNRTSLIALVLAAAACNSPYSNEDLRYLQSLPNGVNVRIDVPGADDTDSDSEQRGLTLARAQQALARPCGSAHNAFTPQFQCLSAEVATGLNRIVQGVLKVVDDVTARPPSKRTPKRRIWGPFADPAGRPLQLQFTLDLEDGDAFAYRLDAWRRTGRRDDDAEVVSGHAADADTGVLDVDLGHLHALGAADNAEGDELHVVYDEHSVDVTLGVRTFAFRHAADGTRRFQLTQHLDVNPDDPAGTALEEDTSIVARWRPDLSGRADVTVTRGDLGEASAYITQCWGADLVQHHWWYRIGELPPVGAGVCAFDDRAEAETD